ncbi:hypothetical protein U1Q18_011244 [Sarracenia purpurea var. burkii]
MWLGCGVGVVAWGRALVLWWFVVLGFGVIFAADAGVVRVGCCVLGLAELWGCAVVCDCFGWGLVVLRVLRGDTLMEELFGPCGAVCAIVSTCLDRLEAMSAAYGKAAAVDAV